MLALFVRGGLFIAAMVVVLPSITPAGAQAPVTINNTADITTTTAHGLQASTDGTGNSTINITNSGAISTTNPGSSAIRSSSGSAAAIGGDITVINSGILSALNAAPTGSFETYGIHSTSYGGAVLVDNTGAITANGIYSSGITAYSFGSFYAPATGTAPQIPAGDVTVRNSATITVGRSGTTANSATWAIGAAAGLNVVPGYTPAPGSPTISAPIVPNVDILNSGNLILTEGSGGIWGDATWNGNVNIVNHGSITASGPLSFYWALTADVDQGNATITNTGALNLTGLGTGIELYGNGAGTLSINNSGDVIIFDAANGDTGKPLEAESEGLGAISITNSGKISNNRRNSAGIFASTSLDLQFQPSGFVAGSGIVNVNNSGAITVTGANSFGIDAGSGSDVAGISAGPITVTTTADVIASGADSNAIAVHSNLGATNIATINIGAGALVQGGSGSRVFSITTEFSQTPYDTNGDGITDGYFYDSNAVISGSAGVLLANRPSIINNAGSIGATNGLAINSVTGTFSYQEYDWSGWTGGSGFTEPPRVTITETFRSSTDVVNNTGTINGDIHLADGNDLVDNKGTINGNIDLGPGNDRLIMSQGTITGSVDAGIGTDTLNLTGGTIGSAMNFETITIDGAGATVRAGSTLDAANISINNATVDGVMFSGGGHVVFGSGANVSLAAGTHYFGANSLVIGSGATLNVTGGQTIAQNPAGGGATSRVAVNGGTVNLRDGAADDTLVINGAFNPSYATLLFDVSKLGTSDQIRATTSTPVGSNVVGLNFFNGDITAASGSLALVAVTGEAAAAIPAPSQAPAANPNYNFQNDPSSVFRKYYLVAGSGNGLHLVWNTNESASTNLPAVNEVSSERQRQSVDGSMDDLLGAEVNGLALAATQITPTFRLWSSGRLAYTRHDGFDLVSTGAGGTVRGKTAPFTSTESSFLGSAQLDLSRLLGRLNDAIKVKIGALAGWTRSDVKFGSTTALKKIGIRSAGSGENQSFVGGGYVLGIMGNYYGVVSANGTYGVNKIGSNLLNATSKYNSHGFVLTSKFGAVVPITKKTRLDLRAGASFGRTVGESHVDSAGNVFEVSTLDTAYVSGSATFFTLVKLSDVVVKPFVQIGALSRVYYNNHVRVGGQQTSFNDSKLTGFTRLGLTAMLSRRATLSTAVRADYNRDFRTVSGNIGLKWKLN